MKKQYSLKNLKMKEPIGEYPLVMLETLHKLLHAWAQRKQHETKTSILNSQGKVITPPLVHNSNPFFPTCWICRKSIHLDEAFKPHEGKQAHLSCIQQRVAGMCGKGEFEISAEQPLETEIGVENADSTDELDVKRATILSWLKEDIEWLRKHSRQKYLGKDFLKRVRGLKASVHGCSIYLSALKDEELELRIRQLEETIENGVVIPGDQSAKKNKRIRK